LFQFLSELLCACCVEIPFRWKMCLVHFSVISCVPCPEIVAVTQYCFKGNATISRQDTQLNTEKGTNLIFHQKGISIQHAHINPEKIQLFHLSLLDRVRSALMILTTYPVIAFSVVNCYNKNLEKLFQFLSELLCAC
jgi:hypothetical protein